MLALVKKSPILVFVLVSSAIANAKGGVGCRRRFHSRCGTGLLRNRTEFQR